MVYPRPLRRGGKIGICTPAGPVVEERLRAAVAALQSDGFDVETTPSAYDKYGLFSAPDDIRRQELEDLFARDDIGAVFSARGGVGASRLLATVDTGLITRSSKPFLTFSDLTALQWLLFKRHEFVTFAGPLAVEWDGAVSEASRRQAWRVLCGESNGDLWGDLPRESLGVLRGPGKVSGILMPGNLSMATTLLGTPFMPDLRDTILLIEDVNEPPHRVDRMLFHLRNAGVLQKLRGLLIGDFGTELDPLRNDALRTSLLDATEGTNYPIICGLPFGHGPERMTLPVGAPVMLDLDRMQFTMHVPQMELV
jgi:muramoyltetrapeptide carboxypeptidase